MDVYSPADDDFNSRPLIFFMYGGSFIGGSKTNPTMVDLCETFAKRGYVTASINYRLAEDIVGFFNQFIFYIVISIIFIVISFRITSQSSQSFLYLFFLIVPF